MSETEFNEEDIKIILSPLSYTHIEGDRAVVVEIFKGEDDPQWFLEVLDEYGNLRSYDGFFDTEEQALAQFKEDVERDGIDAFILEDELDGEDVETVTEYKASKQPDGIAWLETDESILLSLIKAYHEPIEVDLTEDEQEIHAILHLVVENQIAEEEDMVIRTVEKLTRQGLSRHESIHAVAAVLAEDIYDLAQGNIEYFDMKKYRRRLDKLTAKRWKKGQY